MHVTISKTKYIQLRLWHLHVHLVLGSVSLAIATYFYILTYEHRGHLLGLLAHLAHRHDHLCHRSHLVEQVSKLRSKLLRKM
jgi:hypothetical protein